MSTGEIILIVFACIAPVIAFLFLFINFKKTKKSKVKKQETAKPLPKMTAEEQEIAELKQKIFEEKLLEQEKMKRQLEIDEENQRHARNEFLMRDFSNEEKEKETEKDNFDMDFEAFKKRFDSEGESEDSEQTEKSDSSLKDEIKKLSPKMKAILFTDIFKPKN